MKILLIMAVAGLALLISGCASARAVDPWGPDSEPRKISELTMLVSSNNMLGKNKWMVLLKSPENTLELSCDAYYERNNIQLSELYFASTYNYIQKYLQWENQIKTEKLTVKAKPIGSVPCQLEFYGGGYSNETSPGVSFVVPVDLSFSLETLDGVIYLVIRTPAAGGGSTDPGVFFGDHSYWLTSSEVSSLEALVSPDAHERYKGFFSGLKPVLPAAKTVVAPDDDSGKLKP